jgi:hypothetical protein
MSEEPKKKRPVRKKIEEYSDDEIQQVISDALKFYLKADMEKRSGSEHDIDAMVATCQEFLKSFIILGYDFNGDPIPPVIFARNQQEADSLSAYLQKFLINLSRPS